MSEEQILLTPQAAAGELDVSPATLRRWADEFGDFLSPVASPGERRGHRRYTEADMDVLRQVKQLLAEGLTYEQVRQRLADGNTAAGPDPNGAGPAEETVVRVEPADESEPAPSQTALVSAEAMKESPALAFLNHTLAALSETQQSILNSQAANRELLGVLIQDNFNLKEENARLRERITEVERTLARVRQEDEWRRETLRQELDSRIAAIQKMAADALVAAQSVEVPEIKTIQRKPGCLGALLGMSGDTQIVTTPRKKKPAGGKPAPPSGPVSGPAPGAMYPRPTRPPE